jgi:hypothetical protein
MRKAVTDFTATVAMLALLGVSSVWANETFNYTGNQFTSYSGTSTYGGGPGLGIPALDNGVTASVTLNCSPCADGTYSLGAGITNLDLSNLVGFPPNAQEVASVTLQGNNITSWSLSEQASILILPYIRFNL